MTVSVQTPFSASVASGATNVFPYGFKVAHADDLSVQIDGELQVGGYEVTGVGDNAGGDVVFDVNPAAGVKVLRYLNPQLKRETDYQQYGDWMATVVNLEFDRLWLAIQTFQQNDIRALKLPIDTSIDQTLIEESADRAFKVVGFDADGNVTLFAPVDNTLLAAGLASTAGGKGDALVGVKLNLTGAVSRTQHDKNAEHVSVEDFGAVGDGVTDDTPAFVAAFASGAKHVEASGVAYKVGPLAIPATCRRFYSRSGALLTPAASVPSGATVADWITWSSATKGKMWGFEIDAPITTYPNLTVLSLLGCTKMKLQDMQMPEGGRIGVYLGNCSHCKVIDVDVYEFTYKGVSVEGTTAAQSYSNQVLFSNVEGSGSAHCISFVNGERNSAFGNQTADAVSFGIGFNNAQGGIAALNTNFNTGHEAVNLEDSNRVLVAMNNAEWPVAGSNSTDFGISVYGNAAITQFNAVLGNIVNLAGASGIALADNVSDNLVQSNIVNTCNRANIANHAGVLLYGSNCVKNEIKDNVVIDAVGTQHKWGVAEHDFGTGAPSLNTIAQNRIDGFVTADIKRTGKSTPILGNSADLDAFRTYTPTVTAASGVITTASADGYYVEFGDIVFCYVRATITTNGTGAGSISISAPFAGVRGNGSGKELVLTGKALTVEVGANFSVRNYDNSYPGANGAILDIFVMYQRA